MRSTGTHFISDLIVVVDKSRIVALSDESKKDLAAELLKGAKISIVGSEADLSSIL